MVSLAPEHVVLDSKRTQAQQMRGRKTVSGGPFCSTLLPWLPLACNLKDGTNPSLPTLVSVMVFLTATEKSELGHLALASGCRGHWMISLVSELVSWVHINFINLLL